LPGRRPVTAGPVRMIGQPPGWALSRRRGHPLSEGSPHVLRRGHGEIAAATQGWTSNIISTAIEA
jgi:hypothetical protein